MASSEPPNGEEIKDVKDIQEDHSISAHLASLSLSSKTVHADDYLNNVTDVAPPLHVSTTFRYDSNPENLLPWTDRDQTKAPEGYIYSRFTGPNTTRFEAILTQILHGPTLTYSSGLSAFHALLVLLNPKKISIGEGYHGCHGVLAIHQRLTGVKKLDLDCDPEELGPGDVIHVETPLNPQGTAYNLKYFADKAHSRGAFLTVDSTFGPPPLQDPFEWGADFVMHSGTKYLGGHSDMLCGTLSVNPNLKDGLTEKYMLGLVMDRLYIGSVMGSLEGWLGVRSLRTLEIRVQRQSESAGRLVSWINTALTSTSSTPDAETALIQSVVAKIEHASLQTADIDNGNGWLAKQMPNGFGPVFSITLKEEEYARRLPSKLGLFHHATSLGGVESLIEWRTMTDPGVGRGLLRISIGVEGWEDLKADLLGAFKGVFEDGIVGKVVKK